MGSGRAASVLGERGQHQGLVLWSQQDPPSPPWRLLCLGVALWLWGGVGVAFAVWWDCSWHRLCSCVVGHGGELSPQPFPPSVGGFTCICAPVPCPTDLSLPLLLGGGASSFPPTSTECAEGSGLTPAAFPTAPCSRTA